MSLEPNNLPLNGDGLLLDLIYLDEDRVESLLGQLVGGYATGGTETDQDTANRSRHFGATLFGASADLGKSTTSVSASAIDWVAGHANLVNLLATVDRSGMHVDVTGVLDSAPTVFPRAWYDAAIRDALRPGAFVSITGPTKLYDFAAIIASMRGVLALGMAEMPGGDLPLRPKAKAEVKQAESMLNAMVQFEQFVSDRVLVRSYPLGTDDPHHFVGPIKRQHLLESSWTFYAKYGLAPVEDLTVFGQVALIPDQEADGHDLGGGTEQAEGQDIEAILDAMLGVYPNALLATAKWPRVTITPIAVFRRLTLSPDAIHG